MTTLHKSTISSAPSLASYGQVAPLNPDPFRAEVRRRQLQVFDVKTPMSPAVKSTDVTSAGSPWSFRRWVTVGALSLTVVTGLSVLYEATKPEVQCFGSTHSDRGIYCKEIP